MRPRKYSIKWAGLRKRSGFVQQILWNIPALMELERGRDGSRHWLVVALQMLNNSGMLKASFHWDSNLWSPSCYATCITLPVTYSQRWLTHLACADHLPCLYYITLVQTCIQLIFFFINTVFCERCWGMAFLKQHDVPKYQLKLKVNSINAIDRRSTFKLNLQLSGPILQSGLSASAKWTLTFGHSWRLESAQVQCLLHMRGTDIECMCYESFFLWLRSPSMRECVTWEV